MAKNVICRKCKLLEDDWCEDVMDSPDPNMQRDCPFFMEKTNADRIRAMSDEELAVFLAVEIPHGDCYGCDLDCVHMEKGKFADGCKNAWYSWIKQTVGE